MRGQEIVRSPDGDRWRVRRRWSERPLPSLWRRWQNNRRDGEAAEAGFEVVLAALLEAVERLGREIAASGPPAELAEARTRWLKR